MRRIVGDFVLSLADAMVGSAGIDLCKYGSSASRGLVCFR